MTGWLVGIGIVLNIGGIGVTCGAFWYEHRARGYGPMWPWLATRWRRLRVRALRLLGHEPPERDTIRTLRGRGGIQVGGRGEVIMWREFTDDDDVDAQITKVMRNLTWVRERTERQIRELRGSIAASRDAANQQHRAVMAHIRERDITDRAITSGAIRMQVLGLMFASVGGLLTTMATLGS